MGTGEDWAVCESRESRGRGLLFTCVWVWEFFLSSPVEPESLLSVDKIWGREELSRVSPSLSTPTLLLGSNTERCATFQQGKLFTMKDTGDERASVLYSRLRAPSRS